MDVADMASLRRSLVLSSEHTSPPTWEVKPEFQARVVDVLTELARNPRMWEMQDAAGLFGLGESRALVVDANVLCNEILRVCRVRSSTYLLSLARVRWVRLFVASHVIHEVNRDVAEWAQDRGIDPALAVRVWREEFAPLLTRADFEQALLTDGERRRIGVLTGRHAVDVPTAVAALVLRTPLLSEDRDPQRAVYGDDVDPELLRNYVAALRSGELVCLLDRQAHGAVLPANLTWVAGGQMIGVVRSVPRLWLAAAVVVAGGLTVRQLGQDSRAPDAKGRVREVALTGRRVLLSTLEVVTALAMLRQEFLTAFEVLVPEPVDEDGHEWAPGSEVGRNRAEALDALWASATGVCVES